MNRSNSNCGVSSRILRVEKKEPFKAGSITVAMGGSVLSSFVQQEDFYTGQNVKVLVPLEEMSLSEKLFYCQCIEANRFRFSTFGREANYSFDSLLVPSREEVPKKIKEANVDLSFDSKPLHPKKLVLKTNKWKWFVIDDDSENALCNVVAGRYHYPSEYTNGKTPYLSATSVNNGIGDYIDLNPEFEGNVITTAKVQCKTFYQPAAFCATSDINIIRCNKRDINPYIGMFLATVIEFNEIFRWNYGRQCRVNDTKSIRIKLPAVKIAPNEYEPDWQFMEDYIKSLPYSSCL